MKKTVLLIVAVIASLALYAQSPVGNWKASTSWSISQNGKKEEFKITAEEKACIARKIYHFNANGKITISGGDCPTDNGVGSDFSTWKTPGSGKITITWKDKDLDPETFQLEIIGNKMHWIKNYPDDPDVPNDKDFKQVVIEYVKA